MISYNYTLDLQGLVTDVKCAYDSSSPVNFTSVPGGGTFVVEYRGRCQGATEILADARFVQINANNSLGFWACETTPPGTQEQSYRLYLRGYAGYESVVGNITCDVNPIHYAVFPITYRSLSGIFYSQEPYTASINTSSTLVERAVKAVGDIIYGSQSWETNLVVESVITFGVKSFNLPPYNKSDQYLRLYELMIQGILEYEVRHNALQCVLSPQARALGHIHSLVIFNGC
jgi:hypothetical protein